MQQWPCCEAIEHVPVVQTEFICLCGIIKWPLRNLQRTPVETLGWSGAQIFYWKGALSGFLVKLCFIFSIYKANFLSILNPALLTSMITCLQFLLLAFAGIQYMTKYISISTTAFERQHKCEEKKKFFFFFCILESKSLFSLMDNVLWGWLCYIFCAFVVRGALFRAGPRE